MKKLYTAFLLPLCFAAQAQVRPGGDFTPDTTVTFSIAQTKLNVGSAGQNKMATIMRCKVFSWFLEFVCCKNMSLNKYVIL